MAKIQRPFNLGQISDFVSFKRFLSGFVDAIALQFNGNVQFGENIRAAGPYVVGFTSSSNIRGVTHSLGTTPQGYLVLSQTASASLYAPSGVSYTWGSTLIYLQASAGVTATIFVI